MSDHWNSLANLLGTPSVDPLHRKAATPSTPEKAPVKKFDDEATKRPVIDPPAIPAESKMAEPESKPEPTSRIRASWDAVARMFGVAPPPEAPVKLPDPKSTSLEALTSTPPDEDLFAGFSRGRSERNRTPSNIEPEKSDRPASGSDTSRRGSVRPERSESSEHKQDSSKKRRPPSFWESPDEPKSEQREPDRAFVDDEPTAPESRSVPREQRRDFAEDGEQAERRGRRRNIRRGRDSTDKPLEQPRIEDDSRERREPRSTEDRSPRGERPAREPRPPREDRPARAERSARDDRPQREDRPVRDDRPPREARPISDDRPPRGDRPARSERGERESSARGRSGRPNEVRPNEGRREEPINRSRPERIRSEELDRDELPEDSALETREPLEGDEGTKRRRRRRGGSRRRSSSDDVRDERVDEELDDTSVGRQAYGQHMNEEDEDDGERITKITSWIDAISPMIESNMENHKKNSGQDHRGRGRGNQRGGGGGSRRRGGHSGHRD